MFRPVRFLTLLLASLLFAGTPAFASPISIDFEHFPGADGVLGTADDVATPSTLTALNTQFSSLGLTFTGGAISQASFFNGNANNHFIRSSAPSATFSVPVFNFSIQSNSYWNAVLTAYDALGNVLATSTLLNPNVGVSPFFGVLSVSTTTPIASFSILPPTSLQVLMLDNLTFSLPEPSQLLIVALGLVLLAQRSVRRRI